MTGSPTAVQWALGGAAFLVELTMVVVVAVIAFRLVRPRGIGWAAVAATIAVLAFGAIWAIWLSPDADRRLRLWLRVIGCWVLILGIGAVLARTGSPRTAAAYALVGCLVMATASPVLEETAPGI